MNHRDSLDFAVRRADTNDVALLARLNQQLIQDEGHRNTMTIGELETRMHDWLANAYSAHLFSVNEQIAGYVLARDEGERVYIRHYLILDTFRRGGLGRQTFQWMRDNVWSGYTRLRLDVLSSNATGLAFWRALGFEDYCLTMELEPLAGDS